MSKIEMCGVPPPLNLILKHLISFVVSLAKLLSPSGALPAELVVVIVVIVVVVIVTWESKANSSSSVTELQTGTELGKSMLTEDWQFLQ